MCCISTATVRIVSCGEGIMSEGRKDDSGKIRMDLIPPSLLTAVATILQFGAEEKGYGDRNWEEGINYGRVFGALMRHMWAWWDGENLDEESGKSHLWHAGCCLAFLIHYERRPSKYKEFDDRPPAPPLTYTFTFDPTLIKEDLL